VLSDSTWGREAPAGPPRPALHTGEPQVRAHWLRVTSTLVAWCGVLVAVGYTTVAVIAQYVAMSVTDAVARRPARADAGHSRALRDWSV
jgi:F0F1-type ATP synthase membrane subunit c/vacuolar-type H+-ATPase subunit K